MSPSVLLGQRLRRQIRTKVWPVLRSEGFGQFTPLRAYRVGADVLELVEFTTFRSEWQEPRWIGGDLYANGGTFSLHVGVFYLEGPCPPKLPHAQACHRATRLAKESIECPAEGRTFYPGQNGERIDQVVEEALRILQSRGLGVLNHYAKRSEGLPSQPESPTLSPEEASAAMCVCREGRATRHEALEGLHRRLHLADEHLFA